MPALHRPRQCTACFSPIHLLGPQDVFSTIASILWAKKKLSIGSRQFFWAKPFFYFIEVFFSLKGVARPAVRLVLVSVRCECPLSQMSDAKTKQPMRQHPHLSKLFFLKLIQHFKERSAKLLIFVAYSPKKVLQTANLTDFLTICCQFLLQNAHFFGDSYK